MTVPARQVIHPITRHIYRLTEDDLVEVEDPTDGRTGVFDHECNWRSGELRTADPHMVGWVGRVTQRGKTRS